MINKIGILVLCLFSQLTFSQILIRKSLQGQVVNDFVNVNEGIVFNKNTNTGVFLNAQGYFKIDAKVNDTLVISSLSFKSRRVVLSEKDFLATSLKIKLEGYSYQLEEVVISAKNGVQSPIEGNSQAIVDKQYFDDSQSSPKNRTMLPDGNGAIENGVNFVRLYKDIFKTLKRDNPDKTDFISERDFTEVVLNSVGYGFFIDSLKLNEDEVRIFLVYCENDARAKTLLKPESKFELMDFLITKNMEFRKISAFEK